MEVITFAQREQNKQRKDSKLTKSVSDFYLSVIFLHRQCFISALLRLMPDQEKMGEERSVPLG